MPEQSVMGYNISMKNRTKYFVLYFIYILTLVGVYIFIQTTVQKIIEQDKETLIEQARIHFDELIKMREWNSYYGGVYVKPVDGAEPNPYLKDPTLYVDENLTLLRINPAWMTKQLSQINYKHGFSFKLTGLHPINPENAPDSFEKDALTQMIETKTPEYYKIENHTLRFIGVLKVKKDCLECHGFQHYDLGDVIGGISIKIDAAPILHTTSGVEERSYIMKALIFLFITTITLLIHKQLRYNSQLESKIESRTNEILATKKLLQVILDSDTSMVAVTKDGETIFVNETFLHFFDFQSLEDFTKAYPNIWDIFHLKESEIPKAHENVQKAIEKDGVQRHFKIGIKEINVDEKKLNMIIFDEFTEDFKKLVLFKDQALKDSLTKLYNRSKFDALLAKEVSMSRDSDTPFSLVFLDIDYFKTINDTYGHDIGDIVLVELSELLGSNLRKHDFLSRWGGEEFIIILQDTNKYDALQLAQKLRKSVENYNFKEIANMTISLGVTQYKHGDDVNTLFKRVDEALYEAKSNGRNQVVAK